MDGLLNVYKIVATNRSKKERFDMILEPLQATLQLSLISFMPVGTKLTIHNNILYPQAPRWHQSVMRFYNNDNKQDLYFLFHVLVRFTKFYNFMKESDDAQVRSLYGSLIHLSKRGIDNLIQTYSDSNDYALINILQLYRGIMENPDEFRRFRDGKSDPSRERDLGRSSSTSSTSTSASPSSLPDPTTDHSLRDIDKIFVTIKQLYSPHDYYVIYNVLCLLEKSSSVDDTSKLIKGLSTMMEVKYNQIHTWISENIIY